AGPPGARPAPAPFGDRGRPLPAGFTDDYRGGRPMSDGLLEEARRRWNALADDWRVQVGDDGDSNRRLNSDPVLWEFAGDVRGLAVLDAGCGTGYLSRKLRDKGAVVTGVDFAERMIEIARAGHPDIDFRVDSCTELATCGDETFDLLVANYV